MASPLSEDRRQQLDGLVLRMTDAGAPDDEIRAVVEDFKTKYGAEQPSDQAQPRREARLTQGTPQPFYERAGQALGLLDEDGAARGTLGVAVGAAKGAAQTVNSLASIIPGIERIIPVNTEAANPDQEMGRKAENLAEYYGAAKGAVGLGRAGLSLLPNTARAGSKINAAAEAARAADATVDFSPVFEQANRIRELASRGGTMPKSVRNLLQAQQRGERMTFDTARDFYSNISRLSANEYQRLAPAAQRELAVLRQRLAQALQGTAEQVGKGAEYAGGLKEYSRAKGIENTTDKIKQVLTSREFLGPALTASGGGFLYGLGKKAGLF